MSDIYRIKDHGVDWEPLEIENGKVIWCERIAELEATIKRVRNIGPVHKSWNAGEEFKAGWDTYRNFVRQELK